MTSHITARRGPFTSVPRLLGFGAALLAGAYAASRCAGWLRVKYLQGAWERRANPRPDAPDRFEAVAKGDLDPHAS